MQITVKTLTGKKINLTVEITQTIYECKELISNNQGIEVSQIRLIYLGKLLSDEKTLEDYNVLSNNIIHMVLQLRGG